jgi:hypothetical protein
MDQHTIPNSYLKAWCDTAPLPPKHTPFIWLISKDGKTKRRKAPHNVFTEADRYSVRTKGQGDALIIEQKTLGATEDAFVRLRAKLEAQATLSAEERLELCKFATAMFARSKRQGDHFAEHFREVNRQVENLEKQRGAKPGLSLETRFHADNGPAATVAMFMVSWPLYFMQMNITILCTSCEEGFITSDCPLVMNNPDAHKLPPALRAPAPGRDLKIEITLPLTPNRLLLISRVYQPGYFEATQEQVDELNSRVRYGCGECFVSQKGILRDSWFTPAPTPADRWETTPEGIAAEQEWQLHLKAKAEWEAWVRDRGAQDAPPR